MKVIIIDRAIGANLWPLSRDRYPKQFIRFQNMEHSLFQDTFKRSLLLVDLKDIYVVTNKNYEFLVIGEVEKLGYNYPKKNILVEPETKKTLPAIYAGVDEILKRGNGRHDSIVVYPSDHLIEKSNKFAELIKSSEYLTNESLITFGIKPSVPHTGYGYIYPGQSKGEYGYALEEFKENPDYQTTVEYIKKGYYWNSGIFMFNSRIFIEEVKKFTPVIARAFEGSKNMEEAFNKIDENIKIDYEILEKSKKFVVVPADIGWNDLGSFDSFYEVFECDEKNNIVGKNHLLRNSSNNIVHSEDGKLVVTVGVDDLIIIDLKDALLVCKKGQSQRIKEVVEYLKKKKDMRTEYHVQDFRPWGSYEVLNEEDKAFKIKRIKVNPGKKLSYQMHHHRGEHWVVVKGVARVTLDDKERVLNAGESVDIRVGQKHRLENVGKTVLEIIEVQMGKYLEEDDIVRFDDDYGRK
jgi:mannose-1-phosphate guanylyltransferase / mannose-6-phosphate isomerase